MQELWFLCMTGRHDRSSECALPLTVIKWTRNSIANDQREITPKYPKQSYGSCA